MARFDRLTVYNEFLASGLLPIFYNGNVDTAIKIADAIAGGGAKMLELTNRGDNALDVFKALHNHCEKNYPKVILGVGSVVDAPTAAMYIGAGANFIVAPIFDEQTALLCNKRKIPYMPGCGSVSEISRAEELGVEVIKVFPGSQVGGPGFIKAVRGPMPWTRLMPTGGVDATKESLESWFKAGACAVGMGSKLVVKELVENSDYSAIQERVRQCLMWIEEIKGK